MTDPADKTTDLPIPRTHTVWRHYTGNRYIVHVNCRLEATDEPAVLYQAAGEMDAPLWVRSLADWYAHVPGYGARFVQEVAFGASGEEAAADG